MNMNIKQFAKLSPFELKDELIKLADTREHHLLNAGRGNPNFVATLPRHAFWQLGLFATTEAERSFAYMSEGVGGHPQREGIEARFEIFIQEHKGTPGVDFLNAAVSYVRDRLGLDAGDFLAEMTQGIIACNYPVPDRMLRLSEVIVREYLYAEMGRPLGNTKIFATEGGTAAMTYIFNSMRENFLLAPGDKIALGVPIFTPYIEIPELNDYQLVEVKIESTATGGWQYSDAEIDKLKDPAIKAFFVVNPSNPPAVRLDDSRLARIAKIVEDRPDLIILTDDVYGTFCDGFQSLYAACPHNTILVYSYSKYFGATGWRLGSIGIHEDNVLDQAIANLPNDKKASLAIRYSSITTDPEKLPFIDRLVADSRTVALNHTAGLSTPQQVQMVLFSLFSLMDEPGAYRAAMKRIMKRRMKALYSHIGAPVPVDANSSNYYHLLDLETLGAQVYGVDFVKWALATKEPNEMLFRIATEEGVVLLPGRGFGSPHPSGRVSLANLNESDYTRIGAGVRRVLDEYYDEFRKITKSK